jgi:hypothetical protein
MMTKHWKQISLGLGLGVAITLLVPSTVVAQSASPKTPAPATPAKTSAAPAAAKNSAHATETVEYKDPEDMTTRYRPGNNKTTAVSPDATKPAGDSKEAKEKVTIPACDGASKDAAKCAAAPPTPPSAQAAKHKGSIESLVIKQ